VRALAVCQDELVIRTLHRVLAGAFDVEFLVESRPLARRLGERLKVPHMGWNEVTQAVKHPLWHEIPDQARFYFVHSYYVEAGKPQQVVGRGHYGKDFAAALADGSRFAVQFHPEKSHSHGLQLLQNFVAWDGRW
jgi:glutamine amidotransferase